MIEPPDLLELLGVTPMQEAETEKLSEGQREQVLQRLLETQAAEGLTVEFVARSLGCSPSVWSQMRRGQYPGNADKYLLAGIEWLADRTAQAKVPQSNYVETAEGSRILRVCFHAITVPCMAKILLESGAGKTAGLREFCRRRGERAVYLQAGEACSARLGVLMELAEGLGIRFAPTNRAATLYRKIRERIGELQSDPRRPQLAIVIDEATTLMAASLNMLRNLHDDPACRVAVILADTARLEAELNSRRGFAGGYEQLRSRFGAVYAPDLNRKIAERDVRAIAASVLEAVGWRHKPISDEANKFLTRLAQAPGRYRNVVHRIWAVHYLAEAAKVAPRYNVAELDYAAAVVGARWELPHNAPPFGGKALAEAAGKLNAQPGTAQGAAA